MSSSIWSRRDRGEIGGFGRLPSDDFRALLLIPCDGNSRWIAIDSPKAGNSDIYVISADGGTARRLTTGPANYVRPSWSKDGKWIYFGSNPTGDAQIWKAPSPLASAGTFCVSLKILGPPSSLSSRRRRAVPSM